MANLKPAGGAGFRFSCWSFLIKGLDTAQTDQFKAFSEWTWGFIGTDGFGQQSNALDHYFVDDYVITLTYSFPKFISGMHVIGYGKFKGVAIARNILDPMNELGFKVANCVHVNTNFQEQQIWTFWPTEL